MRNIFSEFYHYIGITMSCLMFIVFLFGDLDGISHQTLIIQFITCLFIYGFARLIGPIINCVVTK